MKKLMLMLLVSSSLLSQEEGAGSSTGVEYAKSPEWQNFIFAGTALATITAGVVAVSLDQGGNGSSH